MTKLNAVRPPCDDSTPPSRKRRQSAEGENEEGMSEDSDEDSYIIGTDPGDEQVRPEDVEWSGAELFADGGDIEKETSRVTEDSKDINTGNDGYQDIDEFFECKPCDSRVPRTLNAPVKPSAEAVEKHYVTHLPYRNWCPICVMAKGKEEAHRRGANALDKDDQGAIPTVSLDYNEPDGTEKYKLKTIVGKDEVSGTIIHHKILSKGTGDEWLLKRLVKDLEDLGRRDVVLKTDGEPAIVAMQAKIQAMRDGRTILKNPPAYNPAANGPCEKAVQDATAHARALKIALEARLKITIKEDSTVLDWIIEHAAFLINKFSIGHGGMTPHERLVGQTWRRPLVEFGEMVHAKMAIQNKKKGKEKKNKKKLAARSVEAVWVGQVPRTGEHIVIKPNGDAVRCRTIRRVPKDVRWNASRVLEIQGTPRRPAPSQRDSSVLDSKLVDDEAVQFEQREPRMQQDRDERPAPPGPSGAGLEEPEVRLREVDIRELRITDAILERYGGPNKFTPSCPGCDHKRMELPGHRGHTAVCRRRVYEAMEADEEGKTLLEEARRRMERKTETVTKEPNAKSAKTEAAAKGGAPEGRRKE